MATREEAIFCKIAVKNNLLTPDQCRECEKIRKESGGEKGLIDVILEKGYLPARMVAAILKAQAAVSQEETKPPSTATQEVTDTQFSMELLEPGDQPAVPEQSATIHGELVEDDESTKLPSKPRPGDESYEAIRREIANLPLVSDSQKTGNNVIYNINIKNFQAKGEQQGIVPYRGDVTLHRDDISEDKLLALIKGERVSLPAKTGANAYPAMAPATVTAQQNILVALRQNLLLTLLAVGMIFTMFVVGILLLGSRQPAVVPGGPGDGAGSRAATDTGKSIADMSMEELAVELERGTTTIKERAARQIARRVKNGETTGIDYLVSAMRDSDRDVREIAAFLLSGFKTEEIRDNTFSILLGVFDKYEDVSFKLRCLDVAAKLGISEDDMLNLLKKGIEDENASIRMKSLEVLSAYESKASVKAMASLAGDPDPSVRRQLLRVLSRYDSEYAIRAIVPLVNDADASIAEDAVTVLWQKRGQVEDDPIKEILADPESGPDGLKRVIRHVGNLKVREYTAQYVRLVNHADDEVKLEALNALGALGSEADDALTGEGLNSFRQAWAAAAGEAGLPLRNAIVDTLGRIHGRNAGTLLVEFYKDDSAVRPKVEALVSAFPETVRAAIALYKQQETEKVIQAKLALVEAALKKVEESDLEGAIKALDAVRADTSAEMTQALARTDKIKDRPGLDALYNEVRDNAGYIMYNNAWVKRDQLWTQIVKEAEELAAAGKFVEAVHKIRSTPDVLKKEEGMENHIENAIANINELAEGSAREDIARVRKFIDAENFGEADKLLSVLEKRFPESEFR
ncbi:MAG: hypothetical protein DRP79_09585, partial [Planctomycetota bacterium]